MRRFRCIAAMLTILVSVPCFAKQPAALTLWYAKPAADWEHEGLPIGNGAMGAVVRGGIQKDDIQFNEKTLWTGGPGAPGYDGGLPEKPLADVLAQVRAELDQSKKMDPQAVAAKLGHPVTAYGDYQTFGNLVVSFASPAGQVKTYRRWLDISRAVAGVRYATDGVRLTRTYFASHPAGVIVVRYVASRPGTLSFTVALTAPDNRTATRTAENGRIVEAGALKDNGLKYEAQVQVIANGGTRRDGADGSVSVKGATSAVLILSAGTDYAPHYPDYRGADPHAGLTARVDAAAGKGFVKLLREHERDYTKLFRRVSLAIGQKMPNKPTDLLLRDYGKQASADRALEALYFQYGRYLLIAASRAGSLPANLQGVWNASTAPPWNDDYHVNINLQMNYWPADVTNISETETPFFDFVDGLVEPGRVSAQRIMGTQGWTLNLNTDIWGFTGVIAWPTAFWQPEAGAWLASQYYDHYRFTLDRDFLQKRAYPVMKGAAELWLDALLVDPRDGTLVVSPSYSPEHGPFSAGAAMSQQIVYGLFRDTAEAAQIVGDAEFRGRLEAALGKLDPGLRIGSWGQLQEWKEDWDDPKDEHRHTSHLYALYPGHQISPLSTPKFAEAARITLKARGDSTTAHGDAGSGWSKAWKMSFWARLNDGDHAHFLLAQLLKENTMANLWDAYVGPPFQIDANFGSTAGIAEMLLQSQDGVLDILPALPKAWPSGAVRGLRARGDVTVDIVWRDERPHRIVVLAGHSGPLKVRLGRPVPHLKVVDITSHKSVHVQSLESIWTFEAQAGHRYTMTAL